MSTRHRTLGALEHRQHAWHLRPIGRRILALMRFTATAMVLVVVGLGVPWLLIRTDPHPWPTRAHSLSEVRDRLVATYDDEILVHTLVLVVWLLWGAFCLSFLAETVWCLRNLRQLLRDATTHRAHLDRTGVARTPAALLAGGLILTLAAALRGSAMAVTAPARPVLERPVALAAAAALHTPPAQPAPATPVPYTVAHGDTLWDIAKTHLGDPLRWPEIYRLSRATVQSDGRHLGNPDRIFPGWVLTLPPDAEPASPTTAPMAPEPPPARVPVPAGPTPSPPRPAPPETQSPESHAPSSPAPTTTAPAPQRRDTTPHHPPGIHIPGGGYIGITMAAGITAALTYARIHRRRRSRLTSTDTDATPIADIVDESRRASLKARATRSHAPDHLEAASLSEPPPEPEEPPARHRPAVADPQPEGAITIGTRDGHEVLLAEAVNPTGLGLTGPGAIAAARAIVLSICAAAERLRPHHPRTELLTTRAAFAQLLSSSIDEEPQLDLTAIRAVTIHPTIDHVLADVEHRQLARAHHHTADEPTELVLLATYDEAPPTHLTDPAIRVIILGTWTADATVTADGTITHTSRNTPKTMEDITLFTATREQFLHVLSLIREAHGAGPLPTPTTPEPDPPPQTNPPEPPPPPDTPQPPPPPAAPPPARPQLPRLVIHLLPGFQIDIDGRPTQAGSRAGGDVREFLCLLAAHPEGIRRDEATDALHLEGPAHGATDDLAKIRRSTRRLLQDALKQTDNPAVFLREGERLRLNPNHATSDVALFTAALDAATHLNGDDRITALKRALTFYNGPLLEGSDYLWTETLRDHLRRRAADACGQLADLYEERGDEQAALSRLETAVAIDPYDETVSQRIIRLHLAAGRPDAARRALQSLRARLAEIDATPTPETLSLFRGARTTS